MAAPRTPRTARRADTPRKALGRLSLTERNFVADALRTETVGGILLLLAAITALIWANTPLHDSYETVRDFHLGPSVLGLHLTVEHWAADGLLAVFFFVAGIELKRELVAGDLRDPRAAALPVIAALCGMVIPAVVYTVVNTVGGGSLNGWAVPTATDIAFALAVLAVIGTSLPSALRAFLLTLAVVDDLFAILIIAVFFTGDLNFPALGGAALGLALFWLLLRKGVHGWYVYVPLALVNWGLMYNSGIHATVAGVAMGLMLRCAREGVTDPAGAGAGAAGADADPAGPGTGAPGTETDPLPLAVTPPPAGATSTAGAAASPAGAASPVGDTPPAYATSPSAPVGAGATPEAPPSPGERIEHLVRPFSAGLAVPLFALFSAGVGVSGGALSHVFSQPETLGVLLGLVAGKTLGIFGGTWLTARFTRVKLDDDLAWADLFAVSVLAGIGFTVSLLIGELTFAEDPALTDEVKAAVLVGSLIAAVLSAVLLKIRNARYRMLSAEEERDDDLDGIPDVYEQDLPEYHLRMAAIYESKAAEHRRLAEVTGRASEGDGRPA